MKLGINGLGRIGKLSLWHHAGRKYFSEIVINVGRPVGSGLQDIAAYIEKDSTYGRLGAYLGGWKAGRMIENLDEAKGTMTVNGVPVTILREARSPRDIKWKENDVRLVVDTTGVFNDPTADQDAPKGSLRGHLLAGAEKVLLSAPFKIKTKGMAMPEDAVTTVMGINDGDYIPTKHSLVSAASCTTTCLAYMVKPLLDHFGADRFLSASLVTIHAATGSQEVLDRLPGAGKTDLRKNRSIMNNIILTSTGAAKALPLVIPEFKQIGFIAESVRIPTSTGSLIVLVLNLQEDSIENPVKRDLINSIYEKAAENSPYLEYSADQNVSSDIIAFPAAAAVIESTETHTRTASIRVNLDMLNLGCAASAGVIEVPVTQAVVYGWYDNELGSYTNMLAERTVSIAEQMV